jgi:hypothetical protein
VSTSSRSALRAADLPTPVLVHRVGAAGLCADTADDRWFPAEPHHDASQQAREAYEEYARKACEGCPVRADCLELALRIEDRPGVRAHGVWGGLAPWARTALRRARRRRAQYAAARGRELAEVGS